MSRVITVVAMLCFMIATLTTNVAANVVSPANDFSNLMPEKITFRYLCHPTSRTHNRATSNRKTHRLSIYLPTRVLTWQ